MHYAYNITFLNQWKKIKAEKNEKRFKATEKISVSLNENNI